MKIQGLCLVVLFFSSLKCESQFSKSKSDEKESYFKTDLNYLNDLVYLGRRDSLRVPYLSATVGYYHRSGLFISGALSYLSSKAESRIDLFTVDAGYEFSINDILSGSIIGEKYFYNKASNSIKSDISGILDASMNADLSAIQIGMEAGVSFATKTDYTTTFTAAHNFNLEQNDKGFSINPSLNINFSTLNFYEAVTNKKFGKKHLINNPNYLSLTSTTVANKQGFTLMDFEFSIPIEYKINHTVFYLTPYYAIPQNPISTTTNATITLRNGSTLKQQLNSTAWSENNLNAIFYLEAGINFSF
ncbi:MAG: hypothetical protein WCH78_03480 [Bacteroidota bacterium]